MRMPLVSSRMKQPGQPSRDRIDARNVRTLVAIAVDTCERKVLKLVSAAMLFCNDVVCLERCWMRGRQYSQRPAARSPTCRTISASTRRYSAVGKDCLALERITASKLLT